MSWVGSDSHSIAIVVTGLSGTSFGEPTIQIVLAFGGSPIGTSRSNEKLQRCRELGLIHGILCRDGPTFREGVLDKTGGRGVDLALELVGGRYLAETIESMAVRGRVLLVGLLGGDQGSLKWGQGSQKEAQNWGGRYCPLHSKICRDGRSLRDLRTRMARAEPLSHCHLDAERLNACFGSLGVRDRWARTGADVEVKPPDDRPVSTGP